MNPCEHGNENSDFSKCREIHKLSKTYWLRRKKSSPWMSKEKTNLMPLILLFYSMLIQCSTCFGR